MSEMYNKGFAFGVYLMGGICMFTVAATKETADLLLLGLGTLFLLVALCIHTNREDT